MSSFSKEFYDAQNNMHAVIYKSTVEEECIMRTYISGMGWDGVSGGRGQMYTYGWF